MMPRILHSLLALAFTLVLAASIAPAADAKKPKPFPKLASIDRSFGGTGRVPLPGLVKFPTSELGVQCASSRAGGVYALVQGDGITRKGTSKLMIFARTSRGKRIRKFGRQGMVSFPRFRGKLIKAMAASDGSLFVVSANNDYSWDLRISKISRTGAIDKRWAAGEATNHSALRGSFVAMDVTPAGEVSLWTRDKELNSYVIQIDRNGAVKSEFSGGQLRIERAAINPYQSYGNLDLRADGAVLLSSTAPDGNGTMARVMAFSNTGTALPEFSWHGNLGAVPSELRAQLPNSVGRQNIHRASASWLNSGGIGVAVRAFDSPIAFSWSFRIGNLAPYGTDGFALGQRAGLSMKDESGTMLSTRQDVRADGRVISSPTDDHPPFIRSLDSRGTATTDTQRIPGFLWSSLVDAGAGREYLCGYWGRKEQIIKLKFNRFPFQFASG